MPTEEKNNPTNEDGKAAVIAMEAFGKAQVAMKQTLQSLAVLKNKRYTMGTAGGRSRAPYYNEGNAKGLKPLIDGMIEKGANALVRYSDYPSLRKTTLYARISQGIQFLVENMDGPEENYRKFREVLVVRRAQVGILLEITRQPESIVGEFLNPEEDVKANLRSKIADFLENAPEGTLLHEKGLVLVGSEIEELQIQLLGLPGIIGKITSSEVKLVKMPKQLEPDMYNETSSPVST